MASLQARSLAAQARPHKRRSATLVPPWTRSLGAPVVTTGYGMPSKYEANVQRRQSPGLTPQPQAQHQLHAAAEPVRHHHAERSALRAASFRHAGGRSGAASADDPWPRQAAADADDGRRDAVSVGFAHSLHRMRRQRRHGVGQRCGADRAVHARHDRVQRVHRRVAVHTARRGRHRSCKKASSYWRKAPTARR